MRLGKLCFCILFLLIISCKDQRPAEIRITKEVVNLSDFRPQMKMPIMVYNKAGEVLGFDRIRFSTKDPRIVIVSKTGWIRMFGGGETIVTARHQTLEASVFVHTEKIAGVFIEPKTFNLYLNGQSEIFKVNVFNTLGHMIKKPRKIISLKDESIAKLDGDTLTGLQIGETTLRVKVAAKIAEAKVKVKEGLPPFAKEDREKNKK